MEASISISSIIEFSSKERLLFLRSSKIAELAWDEPSKFFTEAHSSLKKVPVYLLHAVTIGVFPYVGKGQSVFKPAVDRAWDSDK